MNSHNNPDSNNIFLFQVRAMPVLAGWGAFSILTGWAWWQLSGRWLRGLAAQFAGWGAINLLIALFGIRGAQRKNIQFTQGEISLEEHDRQARVFEKVVAVNAALDLGYMAAGAWLNHQPDDERRGMGMGIIIQGLFLFLWDLVLWQLVRTFRINHGRV